MTAFAPRPYQTEAMEAVKKDWKDGVLRTAVSLPTGMGKTVIFSHLVAENTTSKSLIMIHRDELAKQTVKKIHSIAPHLTVGTVKAEQDDVHADVIVGSVPTLKSLKRRDPIANVGLIIVDEAHHAIADTYMTVLRHFGAWERTPTAGFTATLSRADEKALGDVWEKIAYERTALYGIMCGALVTPRGIKVTVGGLHLDEVKESHGDYQQNSLGAALLAANAGDVIARAYLEHCDGKRAVIFAPNVASAEGIAIDMNSAGIPTEVITGTTPIELRDAIYERFEAGETMVISNCMVLTEGWDSPKAEVAIIARATKSPGLYIQMVGRVLRPCNEIGKKEALILDVVGITETMGLASISDLTAGEVNPRDRESLVEAAERQEKEAKTKSLIVGKLASVNVDLFAASHSMWLQTTGGHWFIPAGTRYYTIYEINGMWQVAWSGTYQAPGGGVLYTDMTFDGAMEWAERDATEFDPTIATKMRRWRADKPSEKQLAAGARAKIPNLEQHTRGSLSNALSIAWGSQLLDQKIRKQQALHNHKEAA